MRKQLRKIWLVRLLLILVVGLVVTSLGIRIAFNRYMNIGMKPEEVISRFEETGLLLPERHDVPVNGGSLHVSFVANENSNDTLVFVHGSPGGWEDFVKYLANESLRQRFTLVSVDRPGFGNTLPDRAEPSLTVQANRIAEGLRGLGINKPAIFVGHSLGGPVVVRLAIEHPDLVAGMVLLAPSMDPELEERQWFNWAGKFPLIAWNMPRNWYNSNEEIFPHRKELEALQPELGKLVVPTIVVQGLDDQLVPPAHADYVERTFRSADPLEIRRIPGKGHGVLWSSPEIIKEAIEFVASAIREQ